MSAFERHLKWMARTHSHHRLDWHQWLAFLQQEEENEIDPVVYAILFSGFLVALISAAAVYLYNPYA